MSIVVMILLTFMAVSTTLATDFRGVCWLRERGCCDFRARSGRCRGLFLGDKNKKTQLELSETGRSRRLMGTHDRIFLFAFCISIFRLALL